MLEFCFVLDKHKGIYILVIEEGFITARTLLSITTLSLFKLLLTNLAFVFSNFLWSSRVMRVGVGLTMCSFLFVHCFKFIEKSLKILTIAIEYRRY